MLFDVRKDYNYLFINKLHSKVLNDKASEELKDLYKKLSVMQRNYDFLYTLTYDNKIKLNNILSAYYGNELPEISEKPVIYLNSIFNSFNTGTKINLDASKFDINSTNIIMNLIKQLDNIKRTKNFKNFIILDIQIDTKTVTIIVVNINSNEISISIPNEFQKNNTIKLFSRYIETFLIWISKNIKKKEKEDFVTNHDFTNLITNLEIKNFEQIRNEMMMLELFDSMDLETKLKEALQQKEDKLNDLIQQINRINDEYTIKITKLTEYNSNFKERFEQTNKTINYHTTKTKYLHNCPIISVNENYLSIKIKTNILPVLNMDNVATYIKNYHNRHSQIELEMLAKIRDGEAFLAVCPEEFDIEYYIDKNKERQRRFTSRCGNYTLSRNEHAHIGSGCLGTFTILFSEAAKELNVNKTIINVINYLQSVSPLDAAGKHSFDKMLVLDEFGEKIIYSREERLIGKTREEVSKEIWQKYES